MTNTNLNVNEIEKVARVADRKDLTIKEPGLYNIPMYARTLAGYRYKVYNVLRIADVRATLLIVQNPNKESDIHVLYYNEYQQVFKLTYEMEDTKYMEDLESTWKSFVEDRDTPELNEMYNFWLELLRKYNK